MNSMIKIPPEKLPAPRLEPTKPVRVETVEDKDLRRLQKHVERTRDYKQMKEKHEKPLGRPITWTEERNAELIRLTEEGAKLGEIAEKFGTTKGAIMGARKRLRNEGKVGASTVKSKNDWKGEEIEQVISMYTEGRSLQEIADKIGRSYGAVGKKVSDLGKNGLVIMRKRYGVPSVAAGSSRNDRKSAAGRADSTGSNGSNSRKNKEDCRVRTLKEELAAACEVIAFGRNKGQKATVRVNKDGLDVEVSSTINGSGYFITGYFTPETIFEPTEEEMQEVRETCGDD